MKDAVILCAFTLIACISCQIVVDSNEHITTFDIEVVNNNQQALNLLEIADDIDFIPLEGTNKLALIGEISGIEESKNMFYIDDNTNSPIKVFDKTGKYLYRRGLVGRGPNEVPDIYNMAVDYETNNLYINDGGVVYDADGRMIARNDSISAFGPANIAFFDGKLFATRGSYRYWNETLSERVDFITMYSPSLMREGTIDVPDKGPGTIALHGGIAIVPVVSDILSNNGKSMLMKEGRSDTVFYYSGGLTMQPAFRFDMGNLAVPEDTFKATSLDKDALNGKFVITDFMESDRYVFATIMELWKWKPRYLVFDQREPLNGFLAVGPDGNSGFFMNGIAFTPCYVRDNRLVGYMQAIDIVDNADIITDPELKTIAATLKEGDNPMIVIAKLKK